MRRHIGISISRRNLAVAGLHVQGRAVQLAFSAEWARAGKVSTAELLRTALAEIPALWHDARVCIALSYFDLACGDCFEVPHRSEREIVDIAGSLAESRCAGYSSEDLAIDVRVLGKSGKGSVIDLVAAPQATLEEFRVVVRTQWPKAKLELISSSPSLLAGALAAPSASSRMAFTSAGEGAEFCFEQGHPTAWRWFPLDREPAEPAGAIALHGGLEIPPAFAVAAAAALAVTAKSTNLLRAAPDAPRNAVALLRGPLLLSGTAAALVIFIAGLYFDKVSKNVRSELKTCEDRQRVLWHDVLPEETYRPNMLAVRMKQVLDQRNKTADANRFPSALAFWSEVASVFPNPEPLGLSLESLQLGPDGGRMNGRVKRGESDPLANAAGLEAALNQSPGLAARGEFETKETDIIVRMRLDYHAAAAAAQREALPK